MTICIQQIRSDIGSERNIRFCKKAKSSNFLKLFVHTITFYNSFYIHEM